MNEIIQQFELLNGTYLAKRIQIDFEECIQLLHENKISQVIDKLKELRGTECEHRMNSLIKGTSLKKIINILENRKKYGWFSRIVRKFKFNWLPLRKGGVYKI